MNVQSFSAVSLMNSHFKTIFYVKLYQLLNLCLLYDLCNEHVVFPNVTDKQQF